MPERLFFAIWPEEVQRQQLRSILSELPKRHGREPHPDDLHLTLAFLGELDSARRACAEAAADSVLGNSFSLVLDRLGYWPHPRILWCGSSHCPEALLRLLAHLRRGLLGCGNEPERRPFSPHVTLARKALPVEARPVEPPLVWPVAEFVLVQSNPAERPSYKVLRRWPLAHDEAP